MVKKKSHKKRNLSCCFRRKNLDSYENTAEATDLPSGGSGQVAVCTCKHKYQRKKIHLFFKRKEKPPTCLLHQQSSELKDKQELKRQDGSEHFLVPAQKSTSIYDAVAVNEPSCKNEEIKVERKRSFSKTSLDGSKHLFKVSKFPRPTQEPVKKYEAVAASKQSCKKPGEVHVERKRSFSETELENCGQFRREHDHSVTEALTKPGMQKDKPEQTVDPDQMPQNAALIQSTLFAIHSAILYTFIADSKPMFEVCRLPVVNAEQVSHTKEAVVEQTDQFQADSKPMFEVCRIPVVNVQLVSHTKEAVVEQTDQFQADSKPMFEVCRIPVVNVQQVSQKKEAIVEQTDQFQADSKPMFEVCRLPMLDVEQVSYTKEAVKKQTDQFQGFENRFCFHDENDFPAPEPMSERQKTYPSKYRKLDNDQKVFRENLPPMDTTVRKKKEKKNQVLNFVEHIESKHAQGVSEMETRFMKKNPIKIVQQISQACQTLFDYGLDGTRSQTFKYKMKVQQNLHTTSAHDGSQRHTLPRTVPNLSSPQDIPDSVTRSSSLPNRSVIPSSKKMYSSKGYDDSFPQPPSPISLGQFLQANKTASQRNSLQKKPTCVTSSPPKIPDRLSICNSIISNSDSKVEKILYGRRGTENTFSKPRLVKSLGQYLEENTTVPVGQKCSLKKSDDTPKSPEDSPKSPEDSPKSPEDGPKLLTRSLCTQTKRSFMITRRSYHSIGYDDNFPPPPPPSCEPDFLDIANSENYNKPEFDVVKIPEPVKTNFEVETANQYQGHQKIAAEKPPFVQPKPEFKTAKFPEPVKKNYDTNITAMETTTNQYQGSQKTGAEQTQFVKPRPGFKTAKFPEPVKKMYDSDSAAMETTTNQYQGSQKPGAEQTQFVKPRPGFKTAKFPEPVKKMYDSDSAAMETTTNQYQGSQKPGAEQTQFVKPKPEFKTAKFPEPVKKNYDQDIAAMETTTNQYQGSQKTGADQTQFVKTKPEFKTAKFPEPVKKNYDTDIKFKTAKFPEPVKKNYDTDMAAMETTTNQYEGSQKTKVEQTQFAGNHPGCAEKRSNTNAPAIGPKPNKSPRFEVSKFQGTTEMNSDMTVSTVEPMDKYPASGAFGVGQPHFGHVFPPMQPPMASWYKNYVRGTGEIFANSSNEAPTLIIGAGILEASSRFLNEKMKGANPQEPAIEWINSEKERINSEKEWINSEKERINSENERRTGIGAEKNNKDGKRDEKDKPQGVHTEEHSKGWKKDEKDNTLVTSTQERTKSWRKDDKEIPQDKKTQEKTQEVTDQCTKTKVENPSGCDNPEQTTGAKKSSSTSITPNEEKIMSMGFTYEQAVQALRIMDDNLEKAADWLFAGSQVDELDTRMEADGASALNVCISIPANNTDNEIKDISVSEFQRQLELAKLEVEENVSGHSSTNASAGNEFHSMGSLFSDSDVNNDGKNKTKTNRGNKTSQNGCAVM